VNGFGEDNGLSRIGDAPLTGSAFILLTKASNCFAANFAFIRSATGAFVNSSNVSSGDVYEEVMGSQSDDCVLVPRKRELDHGDSGGRLTE
jgi:hypothetical protein